LRRAERKAVQSGAAGWLGSATLKTKLKMAKLSRAYLTVLEHGEALLARTPTDAGCQLDMAEAATALGLTGVALWILEQARQQDGTTAPSTSPWPRCTSKSASFPRLLLFWQKVAPHHPNRGDLQRKIKDLMAQETIRRGYDGKPGEAGPSTNETAEMSRAEPTATANALPQGLSVRLSREAEALRARIAADPANVNTYLPWSRCCAARGNSNKPARFCAKAGGRPPITSNWPWRGRLKIEDKPPRARRCGEADQDQPARRLPAEPTQRLVGGHQPGRIEAVPPQGQALSHRHGPAL